MWKFIIIMTGFVCPFSTAKGQYFQDFNESKTDFAENNMPGWATRTGDGEITFNQRFTGNSVVLKIDPQKDIQNIWYAFMHRDISASIDIDQLLTPEYELRMEARVKISHGPKRINMYLSELGNGGYLREFDIPEAEKWHTISMVTERFQPRKGKPLMTQISLMDWGISSIYTLEVDYIKVDLVNKNQAHPAFGLPLIYRPPIEASDAFDKVYVATKNVSLDSLWPDLNMNSLLNAEDSTKLLHLNTSGFTLLAWDFSSLSAHEIATVGSGQLEIYTHQISRLADSPKDFGELRICDIYGDMQDWDADSFCYNQFVGDNKLENKINTQTIIDTKMQAKKGAKTVVTISKPVMDRLLSGKTKGLAIMPLGYISASFYTNDLPEKAPILRLHLAN